MAKQNVVHALREMLREQLCCVGRIAARHQLPDDAVWDVAKGFEVIYRRACQQVRVSPEKPDGGSSARRAEPHPGITYLLGRLDTECARLPAAADPSPYIKMRTRKCENQSGTGGRIRY